MSDKEAVAALLEAAADGFESGRYGWTRGNFKRTYRGEVRHCVLGAFRHEALAAEGHLESCDRHDAAAFDDVVWSAETVMNIALGKGTVDWNDHHAKNQEQVIQTLKLAAKDLRNQA